LPDSVAAALAQRLHALGILLDLSKQTPFWRTTGGGYELREGDAPLIAEAVLDAIPVAAD
jgi:hypothetical protein